MLQILMCKVRSYGLLECGGRWHWMRFLLNVFCIFVIQCAALSSGVLAGSLTKKESVFLGDWYCDNGTTKDFFTFYKNGNYKKETELYGREILEKGAFEVQGNTLYLARLNYIADGKESKTNIVFVRDIELLESKKIVLTHEGGLGNVVKTRCTRNKGWFSWW